MKEAEFTSGPRLKPHTATWAAQLLKREEAGYVAAEQKSALASRKPSIASPKTGPPSSLNRSMALTYSRDDFLDSLRSPRTALHNSRRIRLWVCELRIRGTSCESAGIAKHWEWSATQGLLEIKDGSERREPRLDSHQFAEGQDFIGLSLAI